MSKLQEHPGYSVHTATLKQYNQLMAIYDKSGWVWCDGQLASNGEHWETYKGETCVILTNNCKYCNKAHYIDVGTKIISFSDFLLRINKTFLRWGEYNEPFKIEVEGI